MSRDINLFSVGFWVIMQLFPDHCGEFVLCVQAFNGHRGAVTGLAFRQGTQQLMSSSLDRTVKLWSVEDRSYIDTLYGHQSDVIAIDCLRQERILSVGRDRTLRLWKVQS